jgi:hypothetical protein
MNQQTNLNKLYAASYDLSPPLDLELRSRSLLTKLAISSLLNKILKFDLLQEIVLLKGHVMTLKNLTTKSRFKIKLKTKIGKSKYSVLVACRMSNAVNKTSYLEIFCCNALSTCTKVANLLFLNYVVKKISKIASKLTEL